MPKLTQEEIVSRLREDIVASERVRDTETQQNVKAYEYYRAKTMHNEEEGHSKIVSSDVFETVEWVLPALMDIFSPENGTPEYEPVGPEDVAAAEAMTELVRYQFWRQNDGEGILRQAIKDCLMYRPGGIIKYAWEKVRRIDKQSFQGLTENEYAYLSGHPEVSVSNPTMDGYGYNVDAQRTVTEYDGPKLYLLPQHEFLRHPNARNLDESPFAAHVKEVTVDHLRRMEKTGYYKNVEQAIEENAGSEPVDYADTVRAGTDELDVPAEPSTDEARKKLRLYECYVQMDIDGDGILENRIICMVNKVILRNVENVYGRPPFVVIRPIEDTHKFSGITLTEMVLDIQRLRTFLLRQMVDNMAQANNSRKVVDPNKINMADLMLNVPGSPIRTKGGARTADAITELVTQPLNQVTFTVLEYATQLAEQRTGVTKANKGVGDQYQQTATGQLAAINQASQRVRLIAKVIGSGLSPLFRAFVMMNKKFLTKSVAMRLNEKKFLEISPDDLEGNMDLILNIVMGTQSRQQTVINMQQLLSVLGQLNQFMPGVLDANNVQTIITESVKAMGYKNVDRFLPLIFQQDAETGNQELQQKQMQMAMTGGGNGAGGGGQTMGSLAGGNAGAAATTNPTGAGLQLPAAQLGSGGMVRGLPA